VLSPESPIQFLANTVFSVTVEVYNVDSPLGVQTYTFSSRVGGLEHMLDEIDHVFQEDEIEACVSGRTIVIRTNLHSVLINAIAMPVGDFVHGKKGS